MNTAFIPRRVVALEPVIRAAAEELLDRLDGRVRIDLVGDFAGPLTSRVICRVLGVPDAMNTPVHPAGDLMYRRRAWTFTAWLRRARVRGPGRRSVVPGMALYKRVRPYD
ncbi:hypothetical protein [Streptomyces chartreusis]|uniref:hypothetical protein n=1 Tax=Streptomyces chartreusis TaxID=1969 RepID=UPI003653E705